jgi:hypothetical protein
MPGGEKAGKRGGRFPEDRRQRTEDRRNITKAPPFAKATAGQAKRDESKL